MKFFVILSSFILGVGTCFASEAFRPQVGSPIWNDDRLLNINKYADGLGPFFTFVQGSHYFSMACAVVIILAILGFAGHYAIVGPKVFSHHGNKVYAFNLFERIIHLIAAVSWVILVPTGIIIMFGTTFGGGFFVRLCRNLHDLATILFIISVFPMLALWFVRMLPAVYDIKWMIIVGGYLSKKKKPIPAGKFNAGQKAWFWVATIGGLVMIITGLSMYFLDSGVPAARTALGLSQVEILRWAVVIHNILGIICAVFLIVHIYMAAFAIKGAIYSIINGYKEEEEVYILHHYWYQELLRKGKINKSQFEASYTNLK